MLHLLSTLVFCLLTSLSFAQTNQPTTLFFLYDVSGSAANIDFSQQEVETLLTRYAEKGPVRLGGLLIQSESFEQKVYLSETVSLVPLAEIGTFSRRRDIQRKNAASRIEMEKKIHEVVLEFFAYLPDQRCAAYTDIQGALKKFQRISQLPVYAQTTFRLFLISDMKQDRADRQRFQPVALHSSVIVYLMETPHNVAYWQPYFPSNKVILLPDFRAEFIKD